MTCSQTRYNRYNEMYSITMLSRMLAVYSVPGASSDVIFST